MIKVSHAEMGEACMMFAQKYAEDFCRTFEPILKQEGFEFRLDPLLKKPVEVLYLHVWMTLTDVLFDRRLVDAVYDAFLAYSIECSPSKNEMGETQDYMLAALDRRLREYCPAYGKFMASPGVNGIGLTETVLQNLAVTGETGEHPFGMMLHVSVIDRITWTLKNANQFRRKFQILDSTSNQDVETDNPA